MTNILFSWIGNTDLEKFEKRDGPTEGPLARAVLERDFDEIHVASNFPPELTDAYFAWLRSACNTDIFCEVVKLKTAVDYGDIYRFVDQKLKKLSVEHTNLNLTIHLSPGTPQMAQISVLLGKTRYSAKFLQSSREQGLLDVDIPFDISAEFLPPLLKKSGQALFDQASGRADVSAEFSGIVGESSLLRDAKSDAWKFAQFDIPVLILGESGTGKELFARAIINSSSDRAPSNCKSVNCGAIAGDLINSELFGHVKGAFTGAIKDKQGIFAAADGGTVFLDEFGELPQETQVRLLRVLEEKKITPVGSTEETSVDVRIIAATNRNLTRDIADGNFREDLFHRVAVGVVTLPPLRDRPGDIKLLTKELIKSIRQTPGFKGRTLSPKAMNVILHYDWPGNVRELKNALTRACVLTDDDLINEQVMARAIIRKHEESHRLPSEKVGDNFNLANATEAMEKKYIELALKEAKYKKTKAAALLGINNHQTLTLKMKKYGLST
jgi:transcriptional regulator with PAS, ATPase and Fis domain